MFYVMDKGVGEEQYITTAKKVDDAEGVSSEKKKKWFVAIVNNRSEKKCAQALSKMNYEVFVPIQTEDRIWKNGTVKTVECVLIATMVFVFCTEEQRKTDVVKYPLVKHFMVDNTQIDKAGKHPIANIPEKQMDIFRKMLEKADGPITIEHVPLCVGDKVKVIKGKLSGIEGRILDQRNGETFLIVEIDLLGCAKLEISLEDVEKID
jgi:transcription termination/antitermination factor NusG